MMLLRGRKPSVSACLSSTTTALSGENSVCKVTSATQSILKNVLGYMLLCVPRSFLFRRRHLIIENARGLDCANADYTSFGRLIIKFIDVMSRKSDSFLFFSVSASCVGKNRVEEDSTSPHPSVLNIVFIFAQFEHDNDHSEVTVLGQASSTARSAPFTTCVFYNDTTLSILLSFRQACSHDTTNVGSMS